MSRKMALWALTLVLIFAAVLPAYAADESTVYTIREVHIDQSAPDIIGSYGSFEEAKEAFDLLSERDVVIMNAAEKIVAMKDGLVVTNLGSKETLDFTTKYDNGRTPYVSYESVMYYVGAPKEGSVRVAISGLVGNVKLSEVTLIPSAYTATRSSVESKYAFDFYTRSVDGKLKHYISTYNNGKTSASVITIDYAPDFMVGYNHYYSANGYDFYSDPADVVTETNKVGTYFVYYKYLSLRSQTAYTAEQLNAYLTAQEKTRKINCMYDGMGDTFISVQETYGVNAALELCFASHESDFGTSDIAKNKNNLFGIDAKDADPAQAKNFASVQQCILEHSKYLMSRAYLDAFSYIDWDKPTSYYDVYDRPEGWVRSYSGDGKYFGSNLGNKYTGVNVAYASDPWHGEIITALMFNLDIDLGSLDYGKYSIARTNQLTYAYAEPDSDSFALYKYTGVDSRDRKSVVRKMPIGMSMNILGEVGDFYAVTSELPMNADGLSYYAWDYDFGLSVAYVKKSCVDVVFDADIKAYDPPELSSDAALASLSVEGYTLNESFSAERGEYSLSVPSGVASVKVAAVASDAAAHVEIGETTLAEGENKITVTVTAQNGDKKVYTITVQRAAAPSSNAQLSALSLKGASLNEAFSPERTAYTASVPNSTENVALLATAADSAAIVVIDSPALVAGRSTILSATVTAEDGTVKKYVVSVSRESAESTPGDPSLNELYVNGIRVTLKKDVFDYKISLPQDTETFDFEYTSTDHDAMVYVAGNSSAMKRCNSRVIMVTASDGTKALYRLSIDLK